MTAALIVHYLNKMKDSGFKLREKTAIIYGPFLSLTQNLATVLTEHGVDVAIVDKQVKEASRFAASLMDAREVREDYGRAVALADEVTNANQAKDLVSRVAEIFGSVDIFIDHTFGHYLSPDLIDGQLNVSGWMVEGALHFLEGRKRGRIIYMVNHELIKGHAPSLKNHRSDSWQPFIDNLRKLCREKTITVNALHLGITEEYLLRAFPKAPSIDAAKKQIASSQEWQIADPMEIAQVVTFLASPLSTALNGQILKITYGL